MVSFALVTRETEGLEIADVIGTATRERYDVVNREVCF
jgi:hypothetical protein